MRSVLIALSLLLVTSSAANGVSRVVLDKETRVARGAKIEFDLDGSELLIRPSADDRLSILATCDAGMSKEPSHASGCANATLAIDGTRVVFRYNETHGEPVRAVLRVALPTESNIHVRSDGGTIALDGLAASLTTNTLGGDLRLTNVKGTLAVVSGGGNVVLSASQLSGSVQTGGGEMRATNVTGGPLKLHTGAGSITMNDAPAETELGTNGGDVNVGRARGALTIRSDAGNIRVDRAEGALDAITNDGSVTAERSPAASGDVRLYAHRGDVTLRVPHRASMALRAELEWDAVRSRPFKIQAPWPLATQSSRRFDGPRKEPKEISIATASLGAARDKVTLTASEGDIHIEEVGPIVSSPVATPAPPTLGGPAPPLTLRTWLKGSPVTKLERGKVYLIDIWAPWCGPCLGGMQHLTDLQKKHRARGLVVIGMTGPDDYGSTLDAAKKVVKQKGPALDYPVAWDDAGRNYNLWMARHKDAGWPWCFIVGRDGRVAYIGHPEKMEKALEQALAAR